MDSFDPELHFNSTSEFHTFTFTLLVFCDLDQRLLIGYHRQTIFGFQNIKQLANKKYIMYARVQNSYLF